MFGQPQVTQQPLSLFGNQPVQTNAQIQASIEMNPYGNNPLFNAPVQPGQINTERPLSIPIRQPPIKSAPVSLHFAATPKSASHLKLRGFTPSIPNSSRSMPESNIGQMHLESSFTPRRNMRKLVLDNDNQQQTLGRSEPRKSVTFDGELERESVRASSTLHRSFQPLPQTPTPHSPTVAQIQQTPGTIEVIHGYSTFPSMSELMEMSDAALTVVDGFEVHYEGLGSVKFLCKVDLLSASPTGTRKGIKRIPGEIVQFSESECVVYPDDSNKPEGKNFLFIMNRVNKSGMWIKRSSRN